MYSKNNVLLPSKSAYSLEEACKELNLFFNRDDIDIKYLLDLVHQGHIWLHAKFSKDYYLFALPMEWELNQKFDDTNENMIANIEFFNYLIRLQNIYNSTANYDLYLKLDITYAFDLLNKKYDAQPIIVDIYDSYEGFYYLDNKLKDENFSHFEMYEIPDDMGIDDFLQIVLVNHKDKTYIKKVSSFDVHDEIHKENVESGFYRITSEMEEIAEIHNKDINRKIEQYSYNSDWTTYYWYGEEKIESLNFNFKTDDFLILKDEIDILKKGESRKIRETPSYKLPSSKSQKQQLERTLSEKHVVSQKSINKIIYALANMANLDVSQPQAAFAQLQLYCEKNNFELPNKDTCGKAFKDAQYHFNNFNSK
ncbi:hypothetical protein [Acinetobacter bereziniae]|uniref:hypothetical protein n=1 Tax=Acinetobacter bereziniae TaxID=106648 RepID=UPI00224CF035|nr:hypothetical protein [Acinetobacter bereziniae]